jgi:demethylmenaquinone methyltransferase/2-methoxy-6-polyprenyl-1,4-benzoquinol methylase
MEPSVTRVRRTKDEAKQAYNRLSRWYDLVAGSTEKKYRNIGLEFLNAKEGERILEIGYGTGHCVLSLAKAVGEAGHVAGIDISEGMHAITTERLRKAGLLDRVDLQVGDAQKLPFEDTIFDGVFMSFTLELFDTPELPLVLQECRRVLRGNGRIAVVSLIKKPGTAVRIYEWFHEKMPAAVDCRPIYAQPLLQEAGFYIEQVKAMSMWGLPVEIILARKSS